MESLETNSKKFNDKIKLVKRYLSSYKGYKKKCDLHKLKIMELQRLALGNSGMNFDLIEWHASQPKTIKDFINEFNDLQIEYNKMLIDAEKLCKQIINYIDKVSSINVMYYNILNMYYIQDMKLINISIELNYSYRQTLRLFNKALRAFISIYSN